MQEIRLRKHQGKNSSSEPNQVNRENVGAGDPTSSRQASDFGKRVKDEKKGAENEEDYFDYTAALKILEEEEMKESLLQIGLQVFLPYIVAGIGMVGAGTVLNVVKVRLQQNNNSLVK